MNGPGMRAFSDRVEGERPLPAVMARPDRAMLRRTASVPDSLVKPNHDGKKKVTFSNLVGKRSGCPSGIIVLESRQCFPLVAAVRRSRSESIYPGDRGDQEPRRHGRTHEAWKRCWRTEETCSITETHRRVRQGTSAAPDLRDLPDNASRCPNAPVARERAYREVRGSFPQPASLGTTEP